MRKINVKLTDKEDSGKICTNLNKNVDTVSSASLIIHKPRVIHNQKNLLRITNSNISDNLIVTPSFSKYERMVILVKDDSFVQRLKADKFAFITKFDMQRFYVICDSPWVVETTLKIADVLWFTKFSYATFSILNEENKHPQLLRPCQ